MVWNRICLCVHVFGNIQCFCSLLHSDVIFSRALSGAFAWVQMLVFLSDSYLRSCSAACCSLLVLLFVRDFSLWRRCRHSDKHRTSVNMISQIPSSQQLKKRRDRFSVYFNRLFFGSRWPYLFFKEPFRESKTSMRHSLLIVMLPD